MNYENPIFCNPSGISCTGEPLSGQNRPVLLSFALSWYEWEESQRSQLSYGKFRKRGEIHALKKKA